jgi:cephalosporin hydroxylase
MAQLILDTKPEVIVEIGVYAGRSLLPMALALKHNGKGKIYGIDPWDVEVVKESASSGEDWEPTQEHLDGVRAQLERTILDMGLPVVLLHVRSEQVFVPMVIDILHIDGGHSEGQALGDVEGHVPNVREGGYIWFDDCNWPSTQKALHRLEEFSVLENDQGTYRLYRKR